MNKSVNEVEFLIKVQYNDSGKGEGKVFIQDAFRDAEGEDAPFIFWMMACEYLLHKTAQKSNAPYEDAMSKLVKGAMTYQDL